MARGRIIDKVISNSRKVNSVSDQAALLFTWIQAHTDDFGRIEGETEDVLFLIVPRRGWSLEQLDGYLKELFDIGLLQMYHDVNRKRYFQVFDFEEHQVFRNDRAKKPQFPVPVEFDTQWYTKDRQRVQIDTEVKLSKVKSSQGEVNGLMPVTGKPVTPTPKAKAIQFFDGVEALKLKQDVPWLQEFLTIISEKNPKVDKSRMWTEIIRFTSYWTELNGSGTKQRWQQQKTFQVERRLLTWFDRAGFNGFTTAGAFERKNSGKSIIGLGDDDGQA